MKINACKVAIALFAGLGLSVAAPAVPAEAEGVSMNGVYLYMDEDGDIGRWTINTTCNPDCVAHVTTGPGRGFSAPLVDGKYSVTRAVPEGVTCPGFNYGDYNAYQTGSAHEVTVVQWWDPATLHGEVDFMESSAPCGIGDKRDHFTLTRLS